MGPSVRLLECPDGRVVFVFGLATFSYASADQAGRRWAAVQLVTTKIASVAEVARPPKRSPRSTSPPPTAQRTYELAERLIDLPSRPSPRPAALARNQPAR